MSQKEEVIIRDKFHGSPHTDCPACDKAKKDIEHVRCTAIQLYVLRTGNGQRFLKNPEYHCECFKKNPDLHYTIASQLDQSDVKPLRVLKPKKDDEVNAHINNDETKDVFDDKQNTLD
jgi:transposase